MQDKHRKVQGAPTGSDKGDGKKRQSRSAWFDDETFEITADTSSSGKVRLPAVSEALGDRLSELPWIFREVYLDNRAEGEPKLEGSWTASRCCCEECRERESF